MTEGLVALVRGYALEIRNGRTLSDIVEHMKGEVAELDEEIRKVALGIESGDDGMVGEAIDVATCAIDFMVIYDPSATDADWAARIDGIVEMKRKRSLRFGGQQGNLGSLHLATGELLEIADMEGRDLLKRNLASRIVAECLGFVRDDAPHLSAQDVLDLATKKLEKWKTHYSDSIHRVR